MASNTSGGWDARATALEILRSQRVAVIATADRDQPWASTVYYADDGFTLYVNTPSSTTMLRNLVNNPRVSYAIDERRPTYFLQGVGRAEVVMSDADFDRGRSLLAEKVPEAHVGGKGYVLVKITTDVIYVSDFREGYRPRATIVVDGSTETHDA